MYNLFRAIPLLILPAIFYAAVAMSMDPESLRASLAQPLLALTLPSGALWVATRGYAFIVFGAACLFIEIIKSTSTSRWALVENGLAVMTFILALILFLLAPAFGTLEFSLLMVMMLLDFMAGFIVMTISARRDVSFSGHN